MSLKVLVLCGGASEEHDVSLASARSMIEAVKEKILITPLVITKTGQVLSVEDSWAVLEPNQTKNPTATHSLNQILLSKFDVVFPLLHGPYGEDGSMQGFLKLNSVKFVGSDVLASAVGMDKIMMKTVFGAKGLAQIPYIAVNSYDWQQMPEIVLQNIAKLKYPIFVKPANLGSSIGISKVQDEMQLRAALNLAAKYDRRIIVEKGLENIRELEIAILGNDEARVSVVGEILTDGEVYDYENKYTEGRTKLEIPAQIPDYIAKKCQEMALRAFKAIDAAGLARIDFFYDDINNKVYLNEINTMPGFTKTSMYPKLWQATGLSYTELIMELLNLALER